MTARTDLKLTTNIADVSGVTERQAVAFRHLGIRCVADLILHLPIRYEHELAELSVAEAHAQAHRDATFAVRGEISTVRSVPGRRRRVEVTLTDETGVLRVTWPIGRSCSPTVSPRMMRTVVLSPHMLGRPVFPSAQWAWGVSSTRS